jgi:hypothetical protein
MLDNGRIFTEKQDVWITRVTFYEQLLDYIETAARVHVHIMSTPWEAVRSGNYSALYLKRESKGYYVASRVYALLTGVY